MSTNEPTPKVFSNSELERKKLELEIEKIQTPWWKNIELYKVLIPTIAVLASLYFTFGRGLIDSEKSKLDSQKEQLKLEIMQFNVQKHEVIIELDSLKAKLRETEDSLSSYRSSVEIIQDRYGQILFDMVSMKGLNTDGFYYQYSYPHEKAEFLRKFKYYETSKGGPIETYGVNWLFDKGSNSIDNVVTKIANIAEAMGWYLSVVKDITLGENNIAITGHPNDNIAASEENVKEHLLALGLKELN